MDTILHVQTLQDKTIPISGNFETSSLSMNHDRHGNDGVSMLAGDAGRIRAILTVMQDVCHE